MKQLTDILNSTKYIITWTIAYCCTVWTIMLFMFGFNIFSWHNWSLLAHAHINNFAGFVFCILLLAMLPMYIATTLIIIRTKQPLFTFTIPKIFSHLTPKKINTQSAPDDAVAAPVPESPQPAQPTFPDDMPPEVRHAFTRARQNISCKPVSSFNNQTQTNAPDLPAQNTVPETADLDEFPLPAEFDFADTESDTPNSFDMPTFTDITFDSNSDLNGTDKNQISDSNDTADNPVTKYLQTHGINPQQHQDMIIAKKLIIATHDDPEFWIADPETWFAAGAQKPSPIIQLIKASAQTGCQPVLYLAQTNIMDLDTCLSNWKDMGITVITTLSDLPL